MGTLHDVPAPLARARMRGLQERSCRELPGVLGRGVRAATAAFVACGALIGLVSIALCLSVRLGIWAVAEAWRPT